MERTGWIALLTVSIVLCVGVLLFGAVGIGMRYDVGCPGWRRNHRWKVAFTPGYYRQYLHDHPEQPFEVVGAPVVPSKRVLSYSLYGTNPKYMRHMEGNIAQIKEKLPGWKARVYLHNEAPSEWRNRLTSPDVDLFVVRDPEVVPGNSAGAFWRFLPLCEPGVDCVVMDADNRLTNQLIKEIKGFFQTEDKPVVRHHNTFPWPVQAICATDVFKKKGFKLPFGEEQLSHYPHRSTFGSDEAFLLAEVAPHAQAQGAKMPLLLHHYFVKDAVHLPRVLS